MFGIHCVGGILGALPTGLLVNPALGGTGIPDYESKAGELAVAAYEFGPALVAQVKAVLLTLLWSGIGSAILYKLVDLVIGLRVTQEEEREGLDLATTASAPTTTDACRDARLPRRHRNRRGGRQSPERQSRASPGLIAPRRGS